MVCNATPVDSAAPRVTSGARTAGMAWPTCSVARAASPARVRSAICAARAAEGAVASANDSVAAATDLGIRAASPAAPAIPRVIRFIGDRRSAATWPATSPAGRVTDSGTARSPGVTILAMSAAFAPRDAPNSRFSGEADKRAMMPSLSIRDAPSSIPCFGSPPVTCWMVLPTVARSCGIGVPNAKGAAIRANAGATDLAFSYRLGGASRTGAFGYFCLPAKANALFISS